MPGKEGLGYAWEPLVLGSDGEEAGTNWPSAAEGRMLSGQTVTRLVPQAAAASEGPFLKDGILYNMSATQMHESGLTDVLKRTILPTLSVRHFKRALDSMHVTTTEQDLEKFAEWGGVTSG